MAIKAIAKEQQQEQQQKQQQQQQLGDQEEEESAEDIALRRKKCREHQRRYRDQQNSYKYNLELDVHQLHQQIADLQRQKRCLLLTSLAQSMHQTTHRSHHEDYQNDLENDANVALGTTVATAAAVAAGLGSSLVRPSPQESLVQCMRFYYELFAKGLQKPTMGCHGATTTTNPLQLQQQRQAKAQYDKQIGFIKWLFADHMQRGDLQVVPVQVFIDQWLRFTRFFTELQVHMHQCQVVHHSSTSSIVSVNLSFRFRFTRMTLANMFPKLMHNELLIKRIYAKRVDLPCHVVYFLDANKKVVSVSISVDWIPTMLPMLQSPTETLEFVRSCLVIKNGVLGKLRDVSSSSSSCVNAAKQW